MMDLIFTQEPVLPGKIRWYYGFDTNLLLWYVQSTTGAKQYLYKHCDWHDAKAIADFRNRTPAKA